MKKVLLVCCIAFMAYSCSKNCDCNNDWDSTITYVKDDLVSHNGKCWTAVAQGKGIIPGPWQVNGNDIWEECTD